MKSIYVASGLARAADVREVHARLRAVGYAISYDWTAHGSVQRDGPARMQEVALAESNGVVGADMTLVMLPGGRGTHVELGMAIATWQTNISIFKKLHGLEKRYGRPEDPPLPVLPVPILVHVADTRHLGEAHQAEFTHCAFYHHPAVRLVVGTIDQLIAVAIETLPV